MFLKCLDTGMLQSNCYIIGLMGEGDNMGEAVLVDPGVDYTEVVQVLEAYRLQLKYIIMTHAHVDHIFYLNELYDNCGGKVVVHEGDAPLLRNALLNGSVMFGERKSFREADLTVKDGDLLTLDGINLKIIHTPGHTPGSMCIMATLVGDGSAENGHNVKECLFTGDTLFRLGVGRTDLGAGNRRELEASLQRLMELADGLKVYPGHGAATEIGYERGNNPFFVR